MILFLAYLFFLLPIVTVIFFITSLAKFCYAKRINKKIPNSFDDIEIRKRKKMLIASSIITVIESIVFIAIVILLSTEIAYM